MEENKTIQIRQKVSIGKENIYNYFNFFLYKFLKIILSVFLKNKGRGHKIYYNPTPGGYESDDNFKIANIPTTR